MMQLGKFGDFPPQCGKFKFFAEYVEQEKMLILESPRRADAEISQLGVLVRRIPALHDLIKTVGLFFETVVAQPFAFDDVSSERLRILLVTAPQNYSPSCRGVALVISRAT
jgi:hypothetical protein